MNLEAGDELFLIDRDGVELRYEVREVRDDGVADGPLLVLRREADGVEADIRTTELDLRLNDGRARIPGR